MFLSKSHEQYLKMLIQTLTLELEIAHFNRHIENNQLIN